jgi:glycosyltransferase involved in cell wall biosynthesis
MTGEALFLLHTAAPSGAELATERLVAALYRAGVPVAVVLTEDGPLVERVRARGVAATVVTGRFDSRAMTIEGAGVRRLLTGALGLVRLGWAVGAHARRTGARVVVAQSTKALLMGAVAARRAGVPLVWQVHDRISAEYFGPVLATVVRLLGWALADACVANSRSTLSTLLTPGRRAVVAHPGVEPGTPAPDRAPRPAAEAVVAVVGRLTRWKGQDVFLRAVAATAVRPARVLLVGGTHFDEQPYADELRRLADGLGLPVTFTGHVDDPGPHLRDADVLVHCSVLAEPFGQVVVEGMAAGCAVVASRPGGPAEIVRDGVDGLLVDGGDRAQLTAALDRLLGDPALRGRLGAAGRARAAAFDVDGSARVVAALLDEVAPVPERGRTRA